MSKELEAFERYGYHCNHYVNGEKDYKIIEKSLKALEIIKEKKPFVAMLLNCKTVDEYNKHVKWGNAFLTETEFISLKEYLR